MTDKEQDSRKGCKTLIRLADVKRKTGCCRTTIYAAMREGRFPRAIRLGVRSVAWLESEIDAWIDDRVADRDESCPGAQMKFHDEQSPNDHSSGNLIGLGKGPLGRQASSASARIVSPISFCKDEIGS